MIRRTDPKLWTHLVKEMKGSHLWKEVRKRYPELKTDDEIADEVFATFSGRRGAERLREEARRISEGKGDVFTKAKALETLQNVKNAISDFWRGVQKLFGINRYYRADELADMALKDLLEGKNPLKDETTMERESVFDAARRVSEADEKARLDKETDLSADIDYTKQKNMDYSVRTGRDVDYSARTLVKARDRYEKRVHSQRFQAREALQDSMLGLEALMSSVMKGEGKRDNDARRQCAE